MVTFVIAISLNLELALKYIADSPQYVARITLHYEYVDYRLSGVEKLTTTLAVELHWQ